MMQNKTFVGPATKVCSDEIFEIDLLSSELSHSYTEDKFPMEDSNANSFTLVTATTGTTSRTS